MGFLLKLMPTPLLHRIYRNIGEKVGDSLSYGYMRRFGFEPLGEEKGLERLAKYEMEIVSRGFRAIMIEDFVFAGGYGKDISLMMKVRMGPGECPIFPARDFKESRNNSGRFQKL